MSFLKNINGLFSRENQPGEVNPDNLSASDEVTATSTNEEITDEPELEGETETPLPDEEMPVNESEQVEDVVIEQSTGEEADTETEKEVEDLPVIVDIQTEIEVETETEQEVELETPLPVEEPSDIEEPVSTPEPLSVTVEIDYDKIGEVLKGPLRILNNNIILAQEKVNTLINKVAEQQAHINWLEETNRHQQQQIQNFQSDTIRKVKTPLFNELIELGDSIRAFLERQNEKENPNEDIQSILEDVEGFEKSIDSTLKDHHIERYQLEGIGDFDPAIQKVVPPSIPTNDPALDGKVISLSPGYYWTLPYLIINSEVKLAKVMEDNKTPQHFKLVFRLEEVKQYKLVED